MLAAPLTYVRNSQTSALHYNQQIMSRMVPYTGALPPFYAPPAHAAPYLQPHMFNYYAHPVRENQKISKNHKYFSSKISRLLVL